jgi:serine/threonine-protein kinase
MAAAGDKSNDAHPPLGAIIAEKYRVERVLGMGGMGVVVAARQLHLEREVAIKCLLPQAAINPEAVTRFLREGKAAALLKSEHVVRVFDVGIGELGHGVGPYMVMEFLEGEDLSTTLERRGPLPLGEAAELLLQACEAVGEAHSVGIVHRDLKPANLFVIRRPDGSPFIKVLDFGISKIVDELAESEAQSLTGTRSTLGTPVYMSPEQVRSAKKVDARTDIWALGSILQELLTGSPPFDAPTLTGLCAMIIADEPTPIRDLCPDIPREIDELVASCLQKDMNRRLSSVGELATRLAPFASRSSLFALASTVEGDVQAPRRPSAGRISASAPTGRISASASASSNLDTVAQDRSPPRPTGPLSGPLFAGQAPPEPAAPPAAPSLHSSMGPATVSVPAAPRRPTGALAVGAAILLALIGLVAWKFGASTPTTPPASLAQNSGASTPTGAPATAPGSPTAAGAGSAGSAGSVVGAGDPAALVASASAGAGGAAGATGAGGGGGAGTTAPTSSGTPSIAGGPVASHGPGLRRPGKPPGPATTAYDPAKEISPK